MLYPYFHSRYQNLNRIIIELYKIQNMFYKGKVARSKQCKIPFTLPSESSPPPLLCRPQPPSAQNVRLLQWNVSNFCQICFNLLSGLLLFCQPPGPDTVTKHDTHTHYTLDSEPSVDLEYRILEFLNSIVTFGEDTQLVGPMQTSIQI